VLYTSTASTTPLPTPEWSPAETTAADFVKNNQAAGAKLQDADIESVQTGYWNLKQVPSGIQPYTTTPQGLCSGSTAVCTSNAGCPSGYSCLIQDVPAVQVTLKKTGISTFFARVLGWKEFSVGASAVATSGFASTGNGVFPMVISECLTREIFKPGNSEAFTKTIYFKDIYPGATDCYSGQWTTFFDTANDVPTMRKYLDGTMPTPPVKIGDKVYVQPGTETTIYKTVDDLYSGKVVYFPVIDKVEKDDAKTYNEVVAFAAFRIEGTITKGKDKQVFGKFVNSYITQRGSRPGGAQSNTVSPPLLVK